MSAYVLEMVLQILLEISNAKFRLLKKMKKQGYEYFIVILAKNSDKNRELMTLRLSFIL